MAFFYRLGAYLSIGALISSSLILWGQAEVTVDGSLGPAGPLPGPNFTIPHTVGQTVGTNLFHSFSAFNIYHGESASFMGPDFIENIISRVTGGSGSYIDGLLYSVATLWFINPWGVMFGPHASLHVDGSFHVSTADYLRLGEGGRFDATNPENSVLTAAPPEAFGFLDNHPPAPITFRGSGLAVPEDETLSVIGGNIEITGGSRLRAPSGQINVASVASAGEVTLGSDDLTTNSFSRLGRIVMEGSTIDVSGKEEKGGSGGSVFIRGGRLVMRDNSAVLSETHGNADGKGINIRLMGDLTMMNGSNIAIRTFALGDGGNVTVEAEDIVLDENSFLLTNTLGTDPGSGDAGDIKVNADSLRLKGSSQMTASTFGLGQGGTLDVQAEDIVLEGESNLFTVACPSTIDCLEPEVINGGNAGDIKVNATNSLQLKKNAEISTATFGSGKGGDVEITAGNLRLEEESLISTATVGSGQGGDVTVTADSVGLEGGSQIGAVTFGAGNAGSVSVTADDIILEGRVFEAGQVFESGLFVSTAINPSTNEIPTGHSGTLTINAGRLQISDGAIISASTAGSGKGGDIFIHATDIDLLDGGSITAESTSTGLDVQNNPNAGHSGNINIWVSDTFRLFNGGLVSVKTEEANAGDIFLDVGFLLHLRDSSITTSVAGGQGDGGNIIIDPTFVILDNSQIIAQAFRGRGGNIHITTDFLFQSPDSEIDASSELGIEGTVQIDSPDTDITGGITILPEAYFDAAAIMLQACAERFGGDVSSLVARRYEVLPDSPYALRVLLPRAIRTPGTTQQAHVSSPYHGGNLLRPMMGCLGNG